MRGRVGQTGRVAANKLSDTLGGALGYFWRFGDAGDPEKLRSGYIKQVVDSVEVELLNPDRSPAALLAPSESIPEALVGLTTTGVVLVTQLRSITETGIFASERPATVRFKAGVLASKLGQTDKLRSPKFLYSAMRIPDVLTWAGLAASSTEIEYDGASSRVKSARIELLAHDEVQSVRLGAGLSLELRSDWRTSNEMEQRVVGTSLLVGCRSVKGHRAEDAVRVLEHVQDLLHLAYDGYVTAETGVSEADSPNLRERGEFWSGQLMVAPQAATKANLRLEPLFTLADLGGIRGLGRWVKLAETDWRAVSAVTAPYSSGGRTAVEYLLSVGAAIEYWVTQSVRAGRLERGLKSKQIPKALGEGLGSAWSSFVGDNGRWAAQFWDAYIQFKHNRGGTAPTAAEVYNLALSGRIVLECTLLDYVARNKKSSRSYLENHRLDRGVGQALREQLGTVLYLQH